MCVTQMGAAAAVAVARCAPVAQTMVPVHCTRCDEVLARLTEQAYADALKEHSLKTAICEDCCIEAGPGPMYIAAACEGLTCKTWIALRNRAGGYSCRRTTMAELHWFRGAMLPNGLTYVLIHSCDSNSVLSETLSRADLTKLKKTHDVQFHTRDHLVLEHDMTCPGVHHRHPWLWLRAEPPQSFTEVHTQRGVARLMRELPGLVLGMLSGERALAELVCEYAGYVRCHHWGLNSGWLHRLEPFLERCRQESASSREWLYRQKVTEQELDDTDKLCCMISDRCKGDTLCDPEASPFIVPPPDTLSLDCAQRATKRRRLT